LANILDVCTISDDLTEKHLIINDTSLENFHLTKKENKVCFQTDNLGNLSSAYIPVLFFKRAGINYDDFIFNIPYDVYIKNSSNVIYYNTRKPYTSLFHTTSTKIKDIQTIELIHTQNINPYLNFGINYDFISSAGEYSEQINKVNTVSLTGNLSKNRYSAYVAYIFNKFNFQNSGGYSIDTVDIEIVTSPNLQNSTTTLFNQEFSLTQKYRFGNYKNISYKDSIIKVLEPSTSLSYHLKLERKYRIYRDEETENSEVYKIFNFQEENTYDSIGYKAIVNSLRYGSENVFEKKYKFGFSVVMATTYYQLFNFKGYILQNNKQNYFDNGLTGKLYGTLFKKVGYELSSNYYITGYKKNDFRAEMLLRKQIFKSTPKSELILRTSYTDKNPDYFYMSYYSNHIQWKNEFNKMRQVDLFLGLNIPEYSLNVDLQTAYIENYIFYRLENLNLFGKSASPRQLTTGINVLSLLAEKDFRFKVFHTHNKIALQKSSQPDIISLPLFAIYHSLYFKLMIRNSMQLHLGYDVSYSTAYQAYSFDPSLGQFYYESGEGTAGNYPYIGVFVNAKIKKNVYLFVNFSHVNSNIFVNMNPVGINDYPVQGRLYKFGIKWTFKN
jgi:hypothetical protein